MKVDCLLVFIALVVMSVKRMTFSFMRLQILPQLACTTHEQRYFLP